MMKRLLSLALSLVLVLGLFACLAGSASADGDTLTVYAKSGGRRNVRVGDTVTYSYALKLTNIYDLDRVRLDVVFDEECLEFVSVEYPSFRTGDATETVKNGVLHMEKSAITNGGAFSQSISDILTVTFRAKRAGTTYIRTLPQRIEVEGGKESDIYLIENYHPDAHRDALFSTYDYLGDNVPTNATTKLNTSQDVVWFYIKDADGNPVEAGQRFLLSGTDENGKIVSFSAETDEYGFVCYPRVAFGNYSIACDSFREDGSAWFVDDASVIIPAVKNGELSIRREVTARLLQPEDMIDLRISLAWADEFIDRGVPYTNDRPANVSAELEAGGRKYAHAYLSADKSSVVLKNLPRTDAEGKELEYELFPGVIEHYSSEINRTQDGFAVTLRYQNDHDWSKERTEPTCDHSGEVIYNCTDCCATYHYAIAPLGHDYAESGYDSTCERTGYHLFVCKRCGDWYTESTSALGHRWGQWIVDQEQVGDEDGHMYRVCSVCGERQEQILAGPNHKHAYETHVVAPTCTEGGYTEEICGCGKSIIVEGSRTNALGHDFTGNSATRTVIENGCTEDGLVEYTCTRCGEMHAEILPAHGHYWSEWKETIAPTETEVGYEARTCSICGERQTRVIPVLTHVHVLTKVEAKAPTCAEDGYEAHWQCSGCGKLFADAEGMTELNAPVTIPALPHTWGAWVTAIPATETETGVEVRVCRVCQAIETRAIPKTSPFKDVPANAYYRDPVLWAYTHEPQITSGYDDGSFRPDQVCTRAQVVTFLWRAAGEPEPRLKLNPFRDVSESAYYYQAVLWALETGVTTGNSPTTFNPNGECTRAQVVTFLWRAAGEPEPTSTTNPFRDVSASAYYYKAVLWALENGITTGNSSTTFNPTGKCTRAHVVTFLYRANT